MLVKFKIDSFRETDRIQKSIPIFFTNKGLKNGKEESYKVWDYELTDTNGKVWEATNRRKRGGFRKGQIIMTELQGGGSGNRYISRLLTPTEFLKRVGQIIDSRKARIKIDEEEIERVRKL